MNATKKRLTELYFSKDSPISYSSATNLKKEAKKYGISNKEVDEFLQSQPGYYTHKRAPKKYPRRKVTGYSYLSHSQLDLMDLQSLKESNLNYAYVLVSVDCYSRQIWVEPLKTKKTTEVVDAFKKHCVDFWPHVVMSDRGKEFLGKEMKAFADKLQITWVGLDSDVKGSQVERVILNLKNRVFKFFTQHGTTRWIDIIHKFADNINRSPCRAIGGMRPIDVSFDTRIKREKPVVAKTSRFKIGDTVVISRYKRMFEKSYTSSFSNEMFVVRNVNLTMPITYKLKDLKDNEIAGIFYNEELQKARNDDGVFKIETVLDNRIYKKKKQVLVKWMDYPEEFNEWVNENELILL